MKVRTFAAVLVVLQACTSRESMPEPVEAAEYDAEASADEAAGDDMAYEPAPALPSPASSSAPVDGAKADAAWNRERYRALEEKGFKDPVATPLSTFSIDVDTAGYSLVRRFVEGAQLPPKGAVRIEEMLNYFDYAYAPPTDGKPFAIHTGVTAAPWEPEHRLVRVAIKGREVAMEKAPPINLVFLIDVSGSMEDANKLPLLKRSFALLTERLRKEDHVGIVVYAGASGVVLRPTNDTGEILDALDRLQAGGSTNGGAGIEAAYDLAMRNYDEKGVNRVILATDGDFNVGTTSESDLVELVQKKAKAGVFLTVLGFGSGNYNDSTMEQLADKGNGAYAYIDSLQEARKVMVDQMAGTLVTIAKDVKIQVEFNPALVRSYRLIGYENREMDAEDFNDDKKDAGEIGAGHTVTALYEVVPKSAAKEGGKVDALRYQRKAVARADAGADDELMTVKVRYKLPDASRSELVSRAVKDEPVRLVDADDDFKFAAAVASLGMTLRESAHGGAMSYAKIESLAKDGLGDDPQGLRAGFLRLVRETAEVADRAKLGSR
jgi:Ca-activated chloride channel family protein